MLDAASNVVMKIASRSIGWRSFAQSLSRWVLARWDLHQETIQTALCDGVRIHAPSLTIIQRCRAHPDRSREYSMAVCHPSDLHAIHTRLLLRRQSSKGIARVRCWRMETKIPRLPDRNGGGRGALAACRTGAAAARGAPVRRRHGGESSTR